jgi:hypothetical protein
MPGFVSKFFHHFFRNFIDILRCVIFAFSHDNNILAFKNNIDFLSGFEKKAEFIRKVCYRDSFCPDKSTSVCINSEKKINLNC